MNISHLEGVFRVHGFKTTRGEYIARVDETIESIGSFHELTACVRVSCFDTPNERRTSVRVVQGRRLRVELQIDENDKRSINIACMMGDDVLTVQ